MPLVFTFSMIAGCQQHSEGVKTVNGANNFSPSSPSKNFDGITSCQIADAVSSVREDVWKDYEENAVAVEMQWIEKRISIANAAVLQVTKHRSASDMMSGMAKAYHANYYLLFKTLDTNCSGGMVWLDYYSVLNDAVFIYNKDQKVSITGTINNFEVRGFATVNNGEMLVRIVVLGNGSITLKEGLIYA